MSILSIINKPFTDRIWFEFLTSEITCDPVLASLEKQWIAEDQLRLVGE